MLWHNILPRVGPYTTQQADIIFDDSYHGASTIWRQNKAQKLGLLQREKYCKRSWTTIWHRACEFRRLTNRSQMQLRYIGHISWKACNSGCSVNRRNATVIRMPPTGKWQRGLRSENVERLCWWWLSTVLQTRWSITNEPTMAPSGFVSLLYTNSQIVSLHTPQLCQHSYTNTMWKIIHRSFVTRKLVGGDDPFYLKLWVKLIPLKRKRRFSTNNRS